ncbi:hypothetical protein JJQ59_34990 (plasmid) [Cupriavidus necator]|uniref:Uncharacterized protein n=1 Tax=Cupriavidus necator TaxID=106590 RepID=A0A367PTR9_CUPNE|nr:hypothetical protein [Cupriavidus necator]QQX89732.1 hypothetical protein JJQ59_34990 [Cupriavidus necator]RCJ10456.1 hypothetical protein DDK22_00380 [Cupriavidus necator]
MAARCIVSNKLVVAVSADFQAAMAASELAGAPFMRGFVSSVTRTRGIEGGEPMRMIQVTGQG